MLKTSAFADYNVPAATMDEKLKQRMRLNCIYDMFRDKVEENVIYIVYTENEGKIDTTIDQLMSIAACSFTGHYFEPKSSSKDKANEQICNNTGNKLSNQTTTTTNSHEQDCSTSNQFKTIKKSINSNKRKLATTSPTGDNNPINGKEDYDGGDEDEDISSLSINEQIERLQCSIDQLLEEKNKSHEKATQYLTKKMYPVTSYYSDLASQIRRMIENKTNDLVELLMKRSDNSGEIDLHGLNPIQATLVVKQLLKVRQEKLMIDKQGETNVDVITGWGKHTLTTNGHKIKPTIVKLLKDEGYEFCHINKGALRVTLRR